MSVKRAARIGDAWLIVNSSGLGKVAPLMQTYRAALQGIRPHPGRVPDHGRMLCRRAPRDGARGMPRAARIQIQRLCRLGAGRPARRSPFEDFARDRFIIGDKVSVKEEIARYRELLGVDHFIMRCQWPGLPQEQVLGSIQRLGEIFAA